MTSLARIALAAVSSLAAVPAFAQVQQNNPNAANESLSGMSQTRTMQQGAISRDNTQMLNAERSQAAPPPPSVPSPIPRSGAAAR